MIIQTFQTAFWDAGFEDKSDLDRIELVGGGTRSPLFIDFINTTLNFNGTIPVYRSLNTEEAAVIGAGYVVAASRKNYLSTQIAFDPVDAYNITVSKNPKNERIVSFVYHSENSTIGKDLPKLPLGINSFIRTVEMGQTGRYEIVNGRVRVYGCRKLTTSGLNKEKRFSVEKILQAFEKVENEQEERNKKLHEYDTFLIETREKIAKDETVRQVSNADERNRALQLIAKMQYAMQKDPNLEEYELRRMKADIEEVTRNILKKAKDKTEAPDAYQKLADFLELVTNTVENDWPSKGLRPKKKHLNGLGRVCAKTEKWLNEHEDNLNGVVIEDIDLLYEKLRRAFEFVQKNLKPIHSKKDDL